MLHLPQRFTPTCLAMARKVVLYVAFICFAHFCLSFSDFDTEDDTNQAIQDEWQRIKRNIRYRMKNVRSHAHFMNKFRVKTTPHHPSSHRVHIKHRHDENKLVKVNNTGHGNREQHHRQITQNHKVMAEPEQSEGTCKIFTHCVPLPLEAQIGVLYLPECVNLPQCTGGCCSTTDTCHATKEEPIFVNVTAYKYLQNEDHDFHYIGSYLINMTQHLSCGCKKCFTTPTCTENEQLFECDCVCKRQDANGLCIEGDDDDDNDAEAD